MSLVSPLECLGVVFDPVIHSDDNLGDKGVVIYCYAVARDKMKRFVSLWANYHIPTKDCLTKLQDFFCTTFVGQTWKACVLCSLPSVASLVLSPQ